LLPDIEAMATARAANMTRKMSESKRTEPRRPRRGRYVKGFMVHPVDNGMTDGCCSNDF
jgi:hypothetical protein